MAIGLELWLRGATVPVHAAPHAAILGDFRLGALLFTAAPRTALWVEMALTSDRRVLFCGFLKIENIDGYFKKSCLRMGARLYYSRHVYAVREESVNARGPSDIVGKCVAQMKSVDYDVRLEVNQSFLKKK